MNLTLNYNTEQIRYNKSNETFNDILMPISSITSSSNYDLNNNNTGNGNTSISSSSNYQHQIDLVKTSTNNFINNNYLFNNNRNDLKQFNTLNSNTNSIIGLKTLNNLNNKRYSLVETLKTPIGSNQYYPQYSNIQHHSQHYPYLNNHHQYYTNYHPSHLNYLNDNSNNPSEIKLTKKQSNNYSYSNNSQCHRMTFNNNNHHTTSNNNPLRKPLSFRHMFPCCWSDCTESFTSANALRKHLDYHVSEMENQFAMTAVMLVREAAMRGNNHNSDQLNDDHYDGTGPGGLIHANMNNIEPDNTGMMDASQMLDNNHMSNKISNHNTSNGKFIDD